MIMPSAKGAGSRFAVPQTAMATRGKTNSSSANLDSTVVSTGVNEEKGLNNFEAVNVR